MAQDYVRYSADVETIPRRRERYDRANPGLDASPADLETMPVENAIPSGRKTRARIEPSRAFASQGRTPSARPAGQFVDGLSFCVSHSLVAHRPLGSIMRARLRAYPEMSRLRRSTNGVVLAEPVSVAEVPA